jgi:subtilase family serine protease
MERLEGRVFLSAVGHGLLPHSHPVHISRPPARSVHPKAHSNSNFTGGGYTPLQIRHAYGLDSPSLPPLVNEGSGETIAIVDAGDDPYLSDSNGSGFLASDLHVFDQQFGLPDPVFVKMNQAGSTVVTSLPQSVNTDWVQEEALDVEWAHALAPAARIVLIESASDSDTDLLAAVDTAAALPGVVAVSMSWGSSEFAGETALDSNFTTPAGHTGVTFVAAAGDAGSPGDWPAFSPNVVAVGGTSLYLDGAGNVLNETAWSTDPAQNGTTHDPGTGGGVSLYEPMPSYQVGLVLNGTTMRNMPDVAYAADPYAGGVAVYDSAQPANGWTIVGGTSEGAPQFAAIIAITDQLRQMSGAGPLDGPTQTLPEIYALGSAPAGTYAPGTNPFNDITVGSNYTDIANTIGFSAGVGYDAVSGYGSIAANNFISDLLTV